MSLARTSLVFALFLSSPALAQDVAEVSFSNAAVELALVSTGDGACALDITATVVDTEDPTLEASAFHVEEIVVAGADQTVVLDPGTFYASDPGACEEEDETLTCSPLTYMTADGAWPDENGVEQWFWHNAFTFDTTTSAPAGELTVSLRQYASSVEDGTLIQQRERVTLSCACELDWDLNGDGAVSSADYLRLLQLFGSAVEGTEVEGQDVDGDGVVGLGELISLLSQYGESCEG